MLQLCPGAGASGLGVNRKYGRGGLYNLTMGVCDKRKEIHEFSGDWPSMPSPLPQTLLQTASRSHSMHAGSRSSSSSPPETSDWTLEQLLQTFFQHSAVGCAPLEKIGRDSFLLPPSHPNGAADEAVAKLFAHESTPRGGEGGGRSLGTRAWSNVSGYIHELVRPSVVYSDRGSANESVASSSASSSASPAPSFEVEDQGDGRYVMVYNMTRSGLYQIDIVGESGLSLHGVAYDVRVEPGPTEPALALINLESAQATDLRHVIAGRSTVLDIALRDLHGNRRWAWEGGETYARRLRERPGRGGLRDLSDAFTLSIRPMHVPFFNAVKGAQETAVWHASFSKLAWQDYGGGLIRADYTVTTAGLFSLEIALDGIPLGGGSPYQFRIRPGASDMSATTVFGAVSACNAGVRCEIHVEVRDTWGNRRVLEDDSGPNCHRDGLLANCVPVDSPKVPNGQLSSCLNPATGQPGEKWAGDAWCGEASIGSFLVIFPPHAQQRRQGPEMLLLTPANLYSGGYNVTSAGSYGVSVVWDATAGGTRTVNGPHLVHIRHSPFVINITAAETSACRSAVRGSCAASAYAQQACTMMLGLRDAFDNPRLSGGDPVAAFLLGPLAERAQEEDGPQGSEEPVFVRDLLNGDFLLTFLLTIPGAYSLAVSVAGSNIKGSPMRITVRGGFVMTSFDNMPLVNRSLLLVGHASVQGSLPLSPGRGGGGGGGAVGVAGLHLSAVPARAGGAGGAWFRQPQMLTEGFVMDFVLRVIGRSRSCRLWSSPPFRDAGTHPTATSSALCQERAADGLALVLTRGVGAGGEPHAGGIPALGLGGEGMGYEGIRDSLALEFDVATNHHLGDPSGNHISWQSRGPGRPNSPAHAASLSHSSAIPLLSDGLEHRVRVRYEREMEASHVQDPAFHYSSPSSAFLTLGHGGGGGEGGGGGGGPGVMTVWIDDLTRPVLVSPINLPVLLNIRGDEKVWVGMTSGAGEEFAQVVLSSWSLLDTACPSDCNDRGRCTKGKCECEAGFEGAHCADHVTTFPRKNVVMENLHAHR